MRIQLLVGVAIAVAAISSRSVPAQTAAEHIALGNRDHATMSAASALRHYQTALEVDSLNAEALWRASSEAVDLGEYDDAARDSLYQLAERYARRAVQADPKSTWTHFALAKALGRRALSLGVRERVKYAAEIRKEGLESLTLDSLNAGALHVMGMWHAHVMRLSGFSRLIAKTLLGGKALAEANWSDAANFLERAVALEPWRIIHRIELAGVYVDRGNRAKAREEYEVAIQLRPAEYNDSSYKQRAERELRELR